jgi:DNA polymerase-3 subunit delta'
MEVILNELTKKQVDDYIKNPPHALGIYGLTGVGKFSVAEFITSKILNSKNILDNPNLHIVRPQEKDSITIDQVRQIVSFLKLKGSYGDSDYKIVLVDNASAMTHDAQNALLKTLEEPPMGSIIILTSTHKNRLLPTITSRLKSLTIKPVDKTLVDEFFKNSYKQAEIDNAWLISNGRLGVLNAILSDKQHDLLIDIENIKTFLSKNQFERLIQVEIIAKQDSVKFLEALLLVADVTFKQIYNTGNVIQIKKWHSIRKNTEESLSFLKSSANSKLTLTNLVLSI